MVVPGTSFSDQRDQPIDMSTTRSALVEVDLNNMENVVREQDFCQERLEGPTRVINIQDDIDDEKDTEDSLLRKTKMDYITLVNMELSSEKSSVESVGESTAMSLNQDENMSDQDIFEYYQGPRNSVISETSFACSDSVMTNTDTESLPRRSDLSYMIKCLNCGSIFDKRHASTQSSDSIVIINTDPSR